MSTADDGDEIDDVQYSETAKIVCGTTKGEIELLLRHHWSPHGYDRATELFEKGFYDNTHFFRVVPEFLVQFGISYTEDKELQKFGRSTIKDDPQLEPKIPFEPGTISFAGSGPNSRTSQLFFAYRGAPSLGRELWETPIGTVVKGMEHVKNFYSYGDIPPFGKGPVQGKIYSEGRQYIDEHFPDLDSFIKCEVTRSSPEGVNLEDSNDDGDGSNDDSDDGDKAEERDPTAPELRGSASNPSHHHSMEDHSATKPSALANGNGEMSPLFTGCCAVVLLVILVFLRQHGKKAAGKAL